MGLSPEMFSNVVPQKLIDVSEVLNVIALLTEAASTPETSANSYQTARRHNQDSRSCRQTPAGFLRASD
jgi:hypothetical protein